MKRKVLRDGTLYEYLYQNQNKYIKSLMPLTSSRAVRIFTRNNQITGITEYSNGSIIADSDFTMEFANGLGQSEKARLMKKFYKDRKKYLSKEHGEVYEILAVEKEQGYNKRFDDKTSKNIISITIGLDNGRISEYDRIFLEDYLCGLFGDKVLGLKVIGAKRDGMNASVGDFVIEGVEGKTIAFSSLLLLDISSIIEEHNLNIGKAYTKRKEIFYGKHYNGKNGKFM